MSASSPESYVTWWVAAGPEKSPLSVDAAGRFGDFAPTMNAHALPTMEKSRTVKAAISTHFRWCQGTSSFLSSEERGSLVEHFRGGSGGGGGGIFSDRLPVDVVSEPLPSVDMGMVSVRQTFDSKFDHAEEHVSTACLTCLCCWATLDEECILILRRPCLLP